MATSTTAATMTTTMAISVSTPSGDDAVSAPGRDQGPGLPGCTDPPVLAVLLFCFDHRLSHQAKYGNTQADDERCQCRRHRRHPALAPHRHQGPREWSGLLKSQDWMLRESRTPPSSWLYTCHVGAAPRRRAVELDQDTPDLVDGCHAAPSVQNHLRR